MSIFLDQITKKVTANQFKKLF